MLQGEYSSKMDDKGRVSVPIKLRKDLGVEFVVAKGIDSCLELYPMEEWLAYKERINANDKSNPKVRMLIRTIIGMSQTVTPDKQGRININQSLRDIAGLEKEVICIGIDKCVEVWDKDTHEGNQLIDLADLALDTDIKL